MKRSSFIKSLVGLFAAPSIITKIDWKSEPDPMQTWLNKFGDMPVEAFDAPKFQMYVSDEYGQYQFHRGSLEWNDEGTGIVFKKVHSLKKEIAFERNLQQFYTIKNHN